MNEIASGTSVSTAVLAAAAADETSIAGSLVSACKGLERALQLGGEAHDVDQRRTQVVADDVGEALDLVVGALQVDRALLDAQLQAGSSAPRPRRAPG